MKNTKRYSRSEKTFKEDYTEIRNQIAENQTQQKKYPTTYESFKNMLEPIPGQYNPNVFSYYNSNKENLNADLTEDDIKRVRFLLENVVLKFDFSNINVTITDVQGTSKGYSMPESAYIFSQALPLLTRFGIDIQKYRKKIFAICAF